MTPPERDWVGFWYTVARERGVNDVASLGRVELASGRVEWTDFSHSTMDGIGKFGELLRARGYRLPELPRSREPGPPGWLSRLRILARLPSVARPRPIRWRERNEARSAPLHAFPFIVFSRAETDTIHARAKARAVSPNALMPEVLGRILLPELLEPGAKGLWLFPVNMRGAVGVQRDDANVASALLLEAGQGTPAEELHEQIRSGLARGMHWATWWMLHVGRVVGESGVRWLSRRRERTSFYLGTFSHMGAWPPEGSRPSDTLVADSNDAWLCTPPGTRNFPISVGCLIWEGKLSVTLKVHPSILTGDKGESSVKAWLEEFRNQLTAASGNS
jgi:hypothetical protein